ncbi:MFS transporter [uncultured Albimonas sp.]|uniref:MFS transporter n=1 Tax=uncultured Albimonas sp. TaxID=1331701 RepID=UPI0030EF0F21|tara:strand:- start:3398 stop:4729 length:1332 start_codon:yes stop_codon:yes gene_type:complete
MTWPPARILAAYAAPMAPLGALHFPVYVYVLPAYAALGADLGALGVFMLAARLLDGISDPVVGVMSDRTPAGIATRFGRRRPWMALAGPLILVAAAMLLLPPAGPTALHAGIWLTALTLAWTLALTPYLAWGAELTPDYAGRVRVSSWREAAGVAGMLGAAIAYAAADGPAEGLRNVMILLAVTLPPAFAWALWKTPEPADLSTRRLPWREALGRAARNRPFLRLLAAWLANGAANALPASLFLFFVSHRLAAPEHAGTLLAVYFLAAVAGMPLWSRLSERRAKHKVWGGAMLWACAIFAVVPFLGPGDLWAFAAVCVLSGVALGADLALPPAIQADVVDADAAEGGESRAGAYFAVWSVATKAAQALAGGVAFLTLDLVGFDAAAEVNSESSLTTLALLYAGAPVALKLLAVALVWRFPIDAAAQAELRRRIEEAAARGRRG